MDCENSPNNNPLPRFCQKGRETFTWRPLDSGATGVRTWKRAKRERDGGEPQAALSRAEDAIRESSKVITVIPAQNKIFFCFFLGFYLSVLFSTTGLDS